MANARTAVVTGANSGFGRLTALALAADGWNVYATMRDLATPNAASAAELRRAGLSVVELDVTDDASASAAAGTIFAEAGKVDVVVNNARSGYFGVLEAFTPAAAQQEFRTNVFGPLRVNRAFLPNMRERRSGLIVYVSSVVGRVVFPYVGVYTASKWALEALAETASYELAPFGVDVAIVQPAVFATDIFGKIIPVDDVARAASYGVRENEAKLSAYFAATTQGQDPADVAKAIVRLANAPAGTRPLRTTVPYDEGAEALNAAAHAVQQVVLAHVGFGDLLPKALV